MPNMKFVSLHTHSTYSYGDAYGQPSDYVQRAIELGYPALALTEHGNVSSHVKLEMAAKAAKAEGFDFKPMYGCELYTRDTPSQHKYHLGVLAMDDIGYRNLLRLVTKSWQAFYYFPTTTSANLMQNGEGLIVLSGCMGSAMACKSIGGKDVETGGGIDTALKIASMMREKFGDRYYLEVQAFPELPKTLVLNQMLYEVSQRLNIPLVVTLDAHYPLESNKKMHSLIHAISRGGKSTKKTVDQQESEWDYNVPMTLLDRQTIGARLLATGIPKSAVVAALDTTLEIADRCNVILPKTDLVKYPLPEGYTDANAVLWDWLRDGWRYRDMDHNIAKGMTRDDYVARLNLEVPQIIEKGFVDYFLLISDVVRWAKSKGIVVGSGRGSSPASMVCYLLRITEVDPLAFPQMYFERFIDPNRTDYPDIDLDFDDERRDELRRYFQDKFGRDYVGNIGTYTSWKGRNSIDDVARVTKVPFAETERLKEFIIERSSGDSRYTKTLEDTIEQFPLAKAIWDRNPSLSSALSLEGMLKGFGVHAAGLVVSDKPLSDTVALYTRELPSRIPNGPKRKLSVLSVDKKDAEYLGMMKIDMLGLSTLGMIKHCMRMTGMSVDDLYRIPLDDERLIAAFRRGDVKGIFQFSGRTTRMVTSQLMPDNFQELVDINALSRPGPFHSGTTLDYINAKHGKWNRDDARNHWTFNKDIERICGYTKYQIIYQEQLLAICREIGNFSWFVSSQVRKIVSLKYGEAAFNAKRDPFIEGAMSNGLSEKEADIIFRRMVTAGQYAFVLAHSITYTQLGYWAMYFKIYHPSAFYAASLRKTGKEKWQDLMRDAIDPKYAKLRGVGRPVNVLGADLDLSDITWSVSADGKDVIPGFLQIPGIGAGMSSLIVADRSLAWERGQEWGLADVEALPGIGPKKLATVKEWTVDKHDDAFGIATLHNKLNETRSMLNAGTLVDGSGVMLPATSHKSEDLPFDLGVQFYDAQGNMTWRREDQLSVVWIGRVHGRNLRDMFEEYRSREGIDLDPTTIKEPNKKHSMVLYAYDDTDEINIRINRWRFPKLRDLLMRIRLDYDLILVSGYKNRSFGRKIEVNDMWVIDPE
ncbi:MAG TPA: DNA polymerase III subunit alpha [Scandinavium sp.]|uniref:DNA polymerase III subunit alpha n=1 Tax=Scandinavium sp. TaxID=2830653 RepID=UPI002E35B440|nr:DNA polymerase III subunit alpha [Scandinavium sp.]HEX4502148.1 DNA polymerase III subunit alpha [Scandinavium sp.]